jgi:hypothetical protein
MGQASTAAFAQGCIQLCTAHTCPVSHLLDDHMQPTVTSGSQVPKLQGRAYAAAHSCLLGCLHLQDMLGPCSKCIGCRRASRWRCEVTLAPCKPRHGRGLLPPLPLANCCTAPQLRASPRLQLPCSCCSAAAPGTFSASASRAPEVVKHICAVAPHVD